MTLKEHEKVELDHLEGLDRDILRRRINYDTSRLDPAKVNLLKYEFEPSNDPSKFRDGFYSYFRIGAEWLDPAQSIPIVVVPKIEHIDFLSMFMTCLEEALPADEFSSIYDIDFDSKPIKSRELSSILSPLLVVQYLMTVKRIVSRGLRRGYVGREANLNKVKGRIDIRRNQLVNVLQGHQERVCCKFDEYSENTPENRLLKRALVVSHSMISKMVEHSSYGTLSAMCNHCLSAFVNVDEGYTGFIPRVKDNKLYRDYSEALRFAQMILRRQDIAVSGWHSSSDLVPVFRIDMALLFEHYTLAILRQRFGAPAISYQVKSGGRFKADFLIHKGDLRIIADTKYIDGSTGTVAHPEYIKQLSAYARDKTFLKELGLEVADEDHIPIVPCVLIYPTEAGYPLSESTFLSRPVSRTVKFYTMPVTVPTYSRQPR